MDDERAGRSGDPGDAGDGAPHDADGAAPGAPDPTPDETAYDLLQRGRELLAGRHHAQAAVVLARAARLEPRRGSILEPLGRAQFMSGQLERAVETFEALLEVDPSSHYGHYALGRALVRLGRAEEGRTHLRLAVALAPQSRLYRGGLNRLGGGRRSAGGGRDPGDAGGPGDGRD
jgi:tetratricopeptide (TPR) repeat protein